jgi:uncharacterized heparinase superfamily protein
MKALLLISLLALSAGLVPAQTLETDPWFRTEPLVRAPDEMVVMRPHDALEIRRPRYTLDGLGVEIVKAQNPFDLFNPFDPDVRAAAHDNVIWDPHTRQAIGWSIFSIRF